MRRWRSTERSSPGSTEAASILAAVGAGLPAGEGLPLDAGLPPDVALAPGAALAADALPALPRAGFDRPLAPTSISHSFAQRSRYSSTCSGEIPPICRSAVQEVRPSIREN